MNVAPRFYSLEADRQERDRLLRQSHAMALVKMEQFNEATRKINSFIVEPYSIGIGSIGEMSARESMKRTSKLREKFIIAHCEWVDNHNFETCRLRFQAAQNLLYWLLTPFAKDSIAAIYGDTRIR